MQVGSNLSMMSQVKFAAKNTLVKLDDVPSLINVKAQFQPDAKWAAYILLEDGQESLESYREAFKRAEAPPEEGDNNSKEAQEARKMVYDFTKKKIEGLERDLAKLQQIVEYYDYKEYDSERIVIPNMDKQEPSQMTKYLVNEEFYRQGKLKLRQAIGNILGLNKK